MEDPASHHHSDLEDDQIEATVANSEAVCHENSMKTNRNLSKNFPQNIHGDFQVVKNFRARIRVARVGRCSFTLHSS